MKKETMNLHNFDVIDSIFVSNKNDNIHTNEA